MNQAINQNAPLLVLGALGCMLALSKHKPVVSDPRTIVYRQNIQFSPEFAPLSACNGFVFLVVPGESRASGQWSAL